MDYKTFEKYLWDFVKGTAPKDIAEQMQLFIEKNSKAKQDYLYLKGIMQYIENQKQTEPNPFLETRILQKIEQLQNTTKSLELFLTKFKVAIATAVVIIGIGLGFLFGNFYTKSLEKNIPLAYQDDDLFYVVSQIDEVEPLYFP